ncbi:MAG: hypothetical protein CMJ29_05630 [Phycisphaerae bacterium]|nr:hypothetical protein [Phycisphaerae bacterium]
MSSERTNSRSSPKALAGRLARAVLLVLSLALVAWAFARVGVREIFRSEAMGGKTELVVMHWSGDGGPAEDAIVDRALARFEEANPTIHVTRLNPGDAGSFYTKLQTMMAAGDPPDVFYVGAERLAAYADAGLLLSLDELSTSSSTAGDFKLQDFYPSTVDAFRFEDGQVGSGSLWGIPKDFTTVGFYYNRDLLERAGVPEPSSDWTWDDFIDSARAVGSLPDCTGAEFVSWASMVRAVLWTEGVDLIDAEGNIRADDPRVIEVLDRIRSWRHDEERTLTSGRSETANPASRFLGGKLGFAGPFGRWVVPTYRTIEDFQWDYAPLPRGETSANMIATVAWSISSRTEHPEEAWQLVSWLTGATTQAEQAELGLAVPTNRTVAEGDSFIDPATPPSRDRDFIDPVDYARVVPWSTNPALEGTVAKRLDQALRTGDLPVKEALVKASDWWNVERTSPLASPSLPGMPWLWIVGVFIIGLLIALAIGWWMLRRNRPDPAQMVEERSGWLLVSPWVIGFLIFMAVPILLSLALSVTRWSGITTLDEADFVGLANYSQLLGHDDVFWRSLEVTAVYALLAVPIGQIVALIGAVLMNVKVRGVSFFRAAWYLPSILAGVGMAVLFRWVFNAENGLMNVMLDPVLSPLGLEPPDWFVRDAEAFGAPAFAIMSLWLVGGSMMIYLAGLQNVPRSLYEAAEIDRAGPVRRFFSVTLPMISPVILFNVIMSLIGSFQVFTQAFVMTGGGPGDHTRFYVLYLYNQAFDFYEMGYASAMAWLLLLIILGLTMLTLRGSARMVHYEGLR